MSTAANVNVNPRLATLTELGTAVWLDQIQRSLTASGELERLVREDSLRGVTSNPAIFEKAILGSDEYDDQIAELAEQDAGARDVYQAIALQDVGAAADVLRPVWEALDGADGFVSLEVDPDLADDTDRTITEAREYWTRLDRPNVMIKIPGTEAGLPAIETALYEGINVNVTLLFGVAQYRLVMDRFLAAMERRHADGLSLDVHSVASFFVSRVDTEVDKRLDALDRPDLAGRAGLANARAAYRAYREVFEGERFAALRAAGCPVQRPLWASTGVKNPDYPDTLYVDGLAGPDTVNTMPMATLKAAADHAQLTGPTTLEDPSADLAALAAAGVDLDDVTAQLLDEGLAAFVTPMKKLLEGLAGKLAPEPVQASLPAAAQSAIAARMQAAAEQEVIQRMWRKDATLWGPAGAPETADRLGWLDIAQRTLAQVDDLEALRDEVRADGLTAIVLLGMGGSSLAPEVFRRSYGVQALHVLDSTDAAAVAAAPSENALYVVSSKSGGTIETRSAMEHFWAATGQDASRFVAITDPGSSLEELARERGYRRVLHGDPEIGGRYSAMSAFGIAPAVLAGIDVRGLLQSAVDAAENCGDPAESVGLRLGVTLGELALAGRDKLTFVIDPPIDSLGLWLEQLIAESTGKHGRGVLPVADEPLGQPSAYGEDRVFVHLRADDGVHDEAVAALRDAGHPVLTLFVEGPDELGSSMFTAEVATAVIGWVLELNPFDQPNVQSAKDKTTEVLAGGTPPVQDSGRDEVHALTTGPPAYLAIQVYGAPDPRIEAFATALRTRVRDHANMATTFGYGPRYLHSTGQLHKGGPPTGRFLQILVRAEPDVPIPGQDFTFEQLKRAQADGDLLALREAGLPAARVEVGSPDELAQLLELL